MLIKQGLFSKAVKTATSSVSSRAETEASIYVTPGHLAAIKSAVLVTADEHAVYIDDAEVTPDCAPPELTVGYGLQLDCSAISGCYRLVVEGGMRCQVECQQLQIAESGAFSGQIHAAYAEIYGEFHGILQVDELLVIHPKANVSGQVRYGQIRIMEGGVVSGDIAQLKKESGQEESRLTSMTTH